MSISKSYNKNNGVTYVYEVYENKWDPVKKRAINKRRCIGKIDPETGEIIPTRKRKTDTVVPAGSSVPVSSADVNQDLVRSLASQAEYLQQLIDSARSQLEQIQSLLDSIQSR